ncbi:PspC domain-containing protein [Paenibacillus alkalitolerans]|uniref:PspC domain-containing protein n=1 Tax=Paenibacillus alkalitolerans TaxID=2799335 RepID=UPI0018F673C4|nr:PspC domain-containing protein [Paenibacillus alkalitolerans]
MKRLTKSYDRKLSGVLGGLAEYMEVDATIVRLMFVIAAVLTGLFPCVVAYIIAAAVMPSR